MQASLALLAATSLNLVAAAFPHVEGLTTAKPSASLSADPAWTNRLRMVKSFLDATEQPFYWYDPGLKGKVPLVVALHSWSASCDWKTPATTVADYCKAHGWAMVYPNFRGPNARPEACGSDLAVQDVLDAVNWAKRNREIDEDRVSVIGGSGGGYMALLLAGRHPEVFAGVAAFCPISDLARWQADSAVRKNRYARDIVACCGGLPSKCPEEYAKRSPLSYLAHAKAARLPVYIATGIHDGHAGSVPVGHAIRAYNALAAAEDVITEADIATIEETEAVPDHLLFAGEDPFYGVKSQVFLRKTSEAVRLTLFNAAHAGNYPAGLDFLSRQRRGRPADMSLPASARAAKIEEVTK